MKLLIFKNKRGAVKRTADIISNQIKKKPNCVLGLATGKTMVPLYKELIKRKLDFSKVKTFNLDEYTGKRIMHYFMDKYFFRKINIKKENIHFPDSKTKKITRIDLQILGIGRNGHIGFNEPGSSFNSKLRKVKLSKETKKANKIKFNYAYTLGIKDIMNSKKIILLAFGKGKADIIKKTLEGEITEKVPASFLRKHKNATLILEKEAAIKLRK
jgi:glucosamine-6-phosphate deaminase